MLHLLINASSLAEVLDRLATFLAGSLSSTVINWLINRHRSRAETVEIHARTVKVEAEARQVSTQTIIEAQERIVEQGKLIGTLQDALVDVNRDRDNFEFELQQVKRNFDQLSTRHGLALIQIERMHLTLSNHELNYDDTKKIN